MRNYISSEDMYMHLSKEMIDFQEVVEDYHKKNKNLFLELIEDIK